MLSTSFIVFLASSLYEVTSAAPTSDFYMPGPRAPIIPRQTNSSIDNVSLPSDSHRFYAGRFCSTLQRQVEQIAWRDAMLYAEALTLWSPNQTYQAAMDLYMGNHTRGTLGNILEGVH